MYLNVPQLIKRYAPFIPGIPAPATAHDDAPAVCVRINETWIPLVLGALEALTWPDLYAGTEAEREHAAREAQNFMVSVAQGNMDCQEDFMYLLRQKPGNPCVLQQSVDNGFSWTDAFDFGLCGGGASRPSTVELNVSASAYASVMVQIVAAYNGTPQSIAPDMVYDAGPDDELRDMAMCASINMFIAVLAAEIEAQGTHNLDWKDIVRLAAEGIGVAASLIAAVINFTGAAVDPQVMVALAVAEALSIAVIELIELLPDDPNLTPFLDSAIQEYIICHAVNKWAGITPSLPAFSSVYDDIDGGICGADVKLLLQGMFASERMYLSYLSYVQKGFEAIDAGQQYQCGCIEDCSVTISYDTIEPSVYIYGVKTDDQAKHGVWSQGSAAYTGENGYPGRRSMFRFDNVPSCAVHNVSGWVWVKHGNTNGLVSVEVQLFDASDVLIASESLNQTGAREVWRAWSLPVFGQAAYLTVRAAFTSALAGAQNLYIDSIVVS